MPTFSLLKLLPAELRYEIYLYATPPRIVKIEADIEGWEDFWKRWRNSSIVDMHVRPDITYFTPLWDRGGQPHPYLHRRQWPKQTTLERFGFTAQKPRQGHWPLEDQFPFEAILNDGQTTYNLFRRGRLYSKCEIPPLLHTYSDSRRFLIEAGYELTYGTQTHVPKTWFNFKRDILHIRGENGCDWLREMFFGSMQRLGSADYKPDRPVSLFRERDLRQIRQLIRHQIGPTEDFVDLCYLMPNLQQVYVDLWGNVTTALGQSSVSQDALSSLTRLERNRSVRHEYMIGVEEIDLIWAPDWYSEFGGLGLPPNLVDFHDSGVWNCMVWKQERGFSNSFLQFVESHMRGLIQSLVDARHATPQACALEGQSDPRRKAPSCHIVHVDLISRLEDVYYHRQAYWQMLRQRRESWLRSPDTHGRFEADLQAWQAWRIYPAHSPTSPVSASMADTPRYLHDREGIVEWWIRNGHPFTRDTGFQVFP
ncbi:2EXR family [Microdochium nivale]|nr:2EXR family [Microdochium nivale]